jgi:hypothetical protein
VLVIDGRPYFHAKRQLQLDYPITSYSDLKNDIIHLGRKLRSKYDENDLGPACNVVNKALRFVSNITLVDYSADKKHPETEK